MAVVAAIIPEKGLLIATYITPQIADTLQELDIPFIDTAEIIYEKQPPPFIRED